MRPSNFLYTRNSQGVFFNVRVDLGVLDTLNEFVTMVPQKLHKT